MSHKNLRPLLRGLQALEVADLLKSKGQSLEDKAIKRGFKSLFLYPPSSADIQEVKRNKNGDN